MFVALAVVFGVQLARFAGMVRRMRGVPGGHMAVVARGFRFTGLMGFGGVPVVLSRHFVVVRGLGMVFVGFMRSHGRSSPSERGGRQSDRTQA